MPVPFRLPRLFRFARPAMPPPGAGCPADSHSAFLHSSTSHGSASVAAFRVWRVSRRKGQCGARTSCSAGAPGGLVLLSALLLANPALALDANRASASELQTLNGIGPKTAALIVKERARGGPYESLDNLAERVKGIGARKARRLEAAGLRAGRLGAAPDRTPSATEPKLTSPALPPAPRRPIHSPVKRP